MSPTTLPKISPARHAGHHPEVVLTPRPSSHLAVLSPQRAIWLPMLLAVGLASFGLLDSVRSHTPLWWALVGSAAALLAWTAALCGSAVRQGRTFTLEIAPRRHHYVQACAQGLVLLYWGLHWPMAQEWAPLVAAQVIFAYGVDLLLGWSRQGRYSLGFGPFPVVFSTNLFLWFKVDWFFLQLAMVALGFLAKQLFQWDKEGRRAHIFNPSAFPLSVFSIALLMTGTSGITWGPEIAITQFYPPNMYLMLFLVGLPGQLLFGVTSMTMAAVVTTYVFGLAYVAATGVYFFYDSYIPIAVFLGMHLLFTDPSTAPRTELGRVVFGTLYGLTTVALYVFLGRMGLPTFYDKLLQVPMLNASIGLIDRVAQSAALRRVDVSRLGRSLAPGQRRLAYVSVWVLVFAALTAAGGVGDHHPGQWLPFWDRACREGRPSACAFETARLTAHCGQGSGWACNEVALRQLAEPHPGSHDAGRDPTVADSGRGRAAFERGCELGFAPACRNLLSTVSGHGERTSAPPAMADFPIVLRGSKREITNRSPLVLYAMACGQGWPGACATPDSGDAEGRPRPQNDVR